MGGGCIISISPCQHLHDVAYPFDCPNIVCLIPFLTSIKLPSRIIQANERRFLDIQKKTNQKSLWIHIHIPI